MVHSTKYSLLLGIDEDGNSYLRLTEDDFVPYEKSSESDPGPRIILVKLYDEMTVKEVGAMAFDQHWVTASGEQEVFEDAPEEGEENGNYMPTRIDVIFNHLPH